MSVYKACDIRGAVGELSPSLYESWGRSLGRRLPAGTGFLVGGDLRPSTPAFLAALVEGLCQAGMEVVDLGVVPTPVVFFARRWWQIRACAVVTASHSPSGINGLKWMIGELPPSEEEVLALQEEEGEGLPERPRGTRKPAEIAALYCQWLRRTWSSQTLPADLRVVLDPGNGCWAGLARTCLTQVFPGLQVAAIHDRPDGRFPGRGPDCARPPGLRGLAGAVEAERAGLGVAFDGDGDRVALVDGGGHALSAEEATWVLLHSFGEELRDQTFVYDIKFSDRIPETARGWGARPLAQRSGHAFIRTSMIQERACFGAEISGHYFYGQLEGGDDGLFTACRVLAHLGRCGQSLEELRRACPAIFATADLRVALDPAAQEQLLRQVREVFGDRPQVLVDGVRVEFDDGWALLRKSVTEAKLTLRFEGESAASLERLVRGFSGRFPELGGGLYEQYRAEEGEE